MPEICWLLKSPDQEKLNLRFSKFPPRHETWVNKYGSTGSDVAFFISRSSTQTISYTLNTSICFYIFFYCKTRYILLLFLTTGCHLAWVCDLQRFFDNNRNNEWCGKSVTPAKQQNRASTRLWENAIQTLTNTKTPNPFVYYKCLKSVFLYLSPWAPSVLSSNPLYKCLQL